jgi:hypothetical protein
MSESFHTSRMREICTSGSQEGGGETVIGSVPLNPSSSSTRLKNLAALLQSLVAAFATL